MDVDAASEEVLAVPWAVGRRDDGHETLSGEEDINASVARAPTSIAACW